MIAGLGLAFWDAALVVLVGSAIAAALAARRRPAPATARRPAPPR